MNIVSAGDRTSPIVMAIENGHYTVAKYLLDHGAKPNLANEFGLAALYAAIDAQWAPTGWARATARVSFLPACRVCVGGIGNPPSLEKFLLRPSHPGIGCLSQDGRDG